jgi:hypothetical protein
MIAARALVLLPLVLTACGRTPAPTDRAMTDTFHARHATFETIRKYFCDLHHDQTVTLNWSQPQLPAIEERRIQGWLKEVGARDVKYMPDCQLWLRTWTSGVGRNAAFKKYRYGPPRYGIIEVKEPPAKDLNDYLGKRVAIASFEKNLEGNWWIELDHWQ